MAQNGNLWEWTETSLKDVMPTSSDHGVVMGGEWDNSVSVITADYIQGMNKGYDGSGFRVAVAPEPSSLSLLALGGVMVALGRRKRA